MQDIFVIFQTDIRTPVWQHIVSSMATCLPIHTNDLYVKWLYKEDSNTRLVLGLGLDGMAQSIDKDSGTDKAITEGKKKPRRQ